MRSEGKIEMSGKEMKAVAEFIRDRDFAKSGEKFYKTGDKLEMPNAAELAKIKAGVGSAPDRAENRADDSSARRQRRESESQPDAATRRDTRRRSRSRGIEPHVPGSERDERRDAPERETDRDRGYRPDGRDKSEEPYDGGAADGVNMRRTFNDRKTFFRAQNDSHSCSAFAMGMMAADHLKGSPISDKEATGFKKLAGTTSHGYRGSLDDMASQLKSVGLNTKAYKFDKFGDEEMKALNAELDKGHTAVARVQNDRTGNSHYIYVAGRDNDGNYIIGDPDRRNKNNKGPISPERLKKLMSNRMPDGGFVAGWAAKEGKAENIPGSIAFRNAQTRNSKEGDHYRNSRRRDDAGRDDAERRAARDDQKQAPGQVRLKGGLRPVVVIDAGHGGHDSGSTVKGTMEKTITQDIATRVSKYLNKLGIAVERTNPHGGFRALSERSSFANRILGKEDGRRSSDRQIADAFVSIHANDDGVNSRGGGRARGFQTYFHRAKSDDGSSELADTIHSTVVKSDGLDVRDAGKNSKKNFHVIREPKSPAVLLETGFLTNDRDRANLSKPEYRDSMAKRIALGIARYLNGRNPRTKP